MASPTFAASDSFIQGGLKSDANPPEKCSVLPLTPPASIERRAPSEFDVCELAKVFEDCQNNPRAKDVLIKLPPWKYRQLTDALAADPSLGPHIQDKLR
jgi:hypothetical protein